MNRRFLTYLGASTLLGTVLITGLALLLAVTPDWWGPRVGEWHSAPETVQPGDAIVVLGGSTLTRVGTGIALFEQGLAPRLIITGHNPGETNPYLREADLARQVALSQGVPSHAITLLATTSTAEDTQQILSFVQGADIHRVLLVTDWIHSRRAVCMLRRALAPEGVEVAFVASQSGFDPTNWWRTDEGMAAVFSEAIKLIHYGASYGLPFWNCLEGDMDVPGLLGALGLSCLLSFGVVILAHRWALRHALLDIPNERSSHSLPTPKGGGLGIALVSLGIMTIHLLAGGPDVPVGAGLVFVLASASIAAMGWRDDCYNLPIKTRLTIQAGVAVALVLAGGAITQVYLPFLGVLSLGTGVALLASALWIVSLTNIYNFMDGIDGLAGMQALVTGGAWCFLLLMEGQATLALLSGLMAATSLGFLLLNVPPARIFMGDVGSTFLGFSLAALPILAFRRIENPRLLVTGVLFVAPFVFDSTFTMARRALNGENILTAHCSHLYQRLVRMGYSHAQVTGFYSLLAVVSAIGGLFYYAGNDTTALIAVLAVLVMCVLSALGVAILELGRASHNQLTTQHNK
ncbi:MAG: hypothetical protein Kow0063_25920 [Anaerolineae bacterium]